MQKKQLYLRFLIVADDWTTAWYLNQHAKQLRHEAGQPTGADEPLVLYDEGHKRGIYMGHYDDATIEVFQRLNATEEGIFELFVQDIS